LLPIALFWQGLRTGTSPFGGDILMLDYPLLALIKHQMAAGLLPLWNPYAGGGYPLVPFSGLIFYPPLWPLRLLTTNAAITVLTLSHFALAGLGAYLLVGVTCAGRVGRVVGALGFVLSGFMIGHLYAGHLFELGVVAWMPWVFYGAHRLLDRPTPRAALLLGLVTALQVLANGLSFLVFTIYPVGALLLLGLLGRAHRDRRAALRLMALLALAGLVVVGLTAVIVLPFAQVLGWTIRSGGLDFAGATTISLPPAALLMAFSPDAVGNGPQDTYWLNAITSGYWHEFALYAGLLPLLAATLACLHYSQQRRPHVPFYACLAVAGLVLAFGRYTPVYGLIFGWLPGLDLVRVPARWLLPSILSVSVLAGPGVDWLLAQRQGARALLRALRLPLQLGGLLIVALLAGIQLLYLQQGNPPGLPHFWDTLAPAGIRLLVLGGYLLLVLACHADRLIRPAATAALLLAATVVDLGTAATQSITFVDPTSFYTATAVSPLLDTTASTYRVLSLDDSIPLRLGMVSTDLYNASDYAPITLEPYWSITNPPDRVGASTISRASARDIITCFDPRFTKLLSMSVVTFGAPYGSYYLCAPHVGAVHLRLEAAVATERWWVPNGQSWNPGRFLSVSYVYRNTAALPRAFLLPLSAAHLITSPAAQYAAVIRPTFDSSHSLILDPRGSTAPLGLGFLQAAWARLLRPAPVSLPSFLPAGTARVLADDGNSVQVVVRARVASYLVLDDAYYPGWQAWIDGRPVAISRADYVLRAMRVPAGTHLLTFTYAPLSYLAGMVITIGTALVVVAVLAWPRLGRLTRKRLPRPRA
jgi:hypothetical protein